jgi:hypothetical protein
VELAGHSYGGTEENSVSRFGFQNTHTRTHARARVSCLSCLKTILEGGKFSAVLFGCITHRNIQPDTNLSGYSRLSE